MSNKETTHILKNNTILRAANAFLILLMRLTNHLTYPMYLYAFFIYILIPSGAYCVRFPSPPADKRCALFVWLWLTLLCWSEVSGCLWIFWSLLYKGEATLLEMDGWKRGKRKGWEMDCHRISNTSNDCKDDKLTFKREERHCPELFAAPCTAAHPAWGGLWLNTQQFGHYHSTRQLITIIISYWKWRNQYELLYLHAEEWIRFLIVVMCTRTCVYSNAPYEQKHWARNYNIP